MGKLSVGDGAMSANLALAIEELVEPRQKILEITLMKSLCLLLQLRWQLQISPHVPEHKALGLFTVGDGTTRSSWAL
jgi:hypothetical protein